MKVTLPLLFALGFASCADDGPTVASELVMKPGMVIEAETKEGNIRIAYVDTYTREYSWGQTIKRFKHQPRKERWLGSLGMYRPSGDETMHAILEEGQQHFSSTEEANSWLKQQGGSMAHAWTKNGLVVGWKRQEGPGDGFVALSVNVWQIYVGGKMAILGASDGTLRVTGATDDQAEQPGGGNSASLRASP